MTISEETGKKGKIGEKEVVITHRNPATGELWCEPIGEWVAADKVKECVCGQREQDYGKPEDNFNTKTPEYRKVVSCLYCNERVFNSIFGNRKENVEVI